jgi:DNA-binding response OmpR family regulator
MAKILLIEPDKALARTYADALVGAGHTAQLATTAQAALHAADDELPDLVLLELQLVAHSGIEFLYEFRTYADWQNIPVVVLSNVPPAEFNQSVSVLKSHLGVSAYCYKPRTDLKALVRAVDDALAVRTNQIV